MGFDERFARKALEQTDGDMDDSINLILLMQENGYNPDDDSDGALPTKDLYPNLQYKMVILVRTDLKMKPGKVAAQVGHAVLAAYKLACIHHKEALYQWESIGQMKVVVRCPSLNELMDAHQKATKMGIASEYIMDAGRTQVEPGSVTV